MDTKQETNCGSICPCSERCPIGDAIAMIGGRWKLRILCSLNADGTLRYNDLKEKATGITPAMLSASLKELERDGLVTRRQYAEIPVRVEYSTFGTNEDLYNMLTIGDVYDLVCPSEYMIMKLMAEDKVQPLSESFFEEENENNYYIRGVSPYIRNIFETHDINGVTWDKCAAGYMWGVTGFLYNPEAMTEETAGSWKLLEDTEYARQITMKDNVRDAYFAAVGALKSDLLTSGEFIGREDYGQALQTEMNDVSPETVARVQDYLQSIKDNLYSFETDSGKADMITGKVVANYQWSGDAVYAMDQAEEDDYILNFAVPRECTNIYFDGWIMLKSGIDGDAAKRLHERDLRRGRRTGV